MMSEMTKFRVHVGQEGNNASGQNLKDRIIPNWLWLSEGSAQKVAM